MYHSDFIIRDINADKLMALQLGKALSGVKDQTIEQATKIGDGATRLLYYTSCFTDNYQDVCVKLKHEDSRFLEGLVQLVRDKNIVYEMIRIYVDLVFKHKTMQQLEYIKQLLIKAGINISASTLTNQGIVLGITSCICLGVKLNTFISRITGTISTVSVGLLGIYGYVQQAADSAERLRLLSPSYYHALYIRKLEMMYFLVEYVFMEARAFELNPLSDNDVANSMINMVK